MRSFIINIEIFIYFYLRLLDNIIIIIFDCVIEVGMVE